MILKRLALVLVAVTGCAFAGDEKRTLDTPTGPIQVSATAYDGCMDGSKLGWCGAVAKSLSSSLPENYPLYMEFAKKACNANNRDGNGSTCRSIWRDVVKPIIWTWDDVRPEERRNINAQYLRGRIERKFEDQKTHYVESADVDWLATRLVYWCDNATEVLRRQICGEAYDLFRFLGVDNNDPRMQAIASKNCSYGYEFACKRIGLSDSDAKNAADAGRAAVMERLEQHKADTEAAERQRKQDLDNTLNAIQAVGAAASTAIAQTSRQTQQRQLQQIQSGSGSGASAGACQSRCPAPSTTSQRALYEQAACVCQCMGNSQCYEKNMASARSVSGAPYSWSSDFGKDYGPINKSSPAYTPPPSNCPAGQVCANRGD